MLERILVSFRDERSADETFGAWIDRQEPGRLQPAGRRPRRAAARARDAAVPPPGPAPPRFVGPAWLEAHLSDPTVRVVEVSRDPALFPASRITGAIAIDAESLDAAHDGRDLLAALGATPDDLIVLYGDRENRDAALAYRLLHDAGHTALRLLDGGRRRWIGEGRPVEAGDAPLALVIEASEAAPTGDEVPSDAVVLDVAEAEADATVTDAVRLPGTGGSRGRRPPRPARPAQAVRGGGRRAAGAARRDRGADAPGGGHRLVRAARGARLPVRRRRRGRCLRHGGRTVTYVIAEPCVDVMDRSCVEVCPVDCIHESGRMLVIDPEECIDCGACEPECPVEAIFPEDAVPLAWDDFVRITHAYGDGLETVANLVAERVAAYPPPPIEGHRTVG